MSKLVRIILSSSLAVVISVVGYVSVLGNTGGGPIVDPQSIKIEKKF